MRLIPAAPALAGTSPPVHTLSPHLALCRYASTGSAAASACSANAAPSATRPSASSRWRGSAHSCEPWGLRASRALPHLGCRRVSAPAACQLNRRPILCRRHMHALSSLLVPCPPALPSCAAPHSRPRSTAATAGGAAARAQASGARSPRISSGPAPFAGGRSAGPGPAGAGGERGERGRAAGHPSAHRPHGEATPSRHPHPCRQVLDRHVWAGGAATGHRRAG